MLTTEEKLDLLIQHVSDLRANHEALKYFSQLLIPTLLTFIPKENALQILDAARSAKVTAFVIAGDDQRDVAITKLKVEEAIHGLIDEAERKVRS